MAYEYERINNIGCVTSPIRTDQAVEELKEVYRKAKAFDRIAEVHSDNDLYSDEYVLETIQEQIDKMERD